MRYVGKTFGRTTSKDNLLKRRIEEETMDTTQDDKETYEKAFKRFYIAGVQHHQMYKILQHLEVGDIFQLVPEPTNKFDPNAIRIEKPRMSGESGACRRMSRQGYHVPGPDCRTS